MTTDQMRKLGEDSMGAAMSSFSAWTKNAQAITAEVVDYSKKSLEGCAAAWEIADAKSLDKAAEVQSEYLRSACEDFVTEATKLGELYIDLAKKAYEPFESMFTKASTE